MALNKTEKLKYLDILGLGSDATYVEIKRAYKRLMKMYASETSVLTPITIEFSKKKRREIVGQIEDAYHKISAQMEYEQSLIEQFKKTPARMKITSEKEQKGVVFDGQMLQKVRRKLGIQLFDVALETKIRKEILQNIEKEKFENLPPEVYLRGHILTYAKYLSLNPKKVADDYLEKYISWKAENRNR